MIRSMQVEELEPGDVARLRKSGLVVSVEAVDLAGQTALCVWNDDDRGERRWWFLLKQLELVSKYSG